LCNTTRMIYAEHTYCIMTGRDMDAAVRRAGRVGQDKTGKAVVENEEGLDRALQTWSGIGCLSLHATAACLPARCCLSIHPSCPVLSCPVLSCPVLVFHCGVHAGLRAFRGVSLACPGPLLPLTLTYPTGAVLSFLACSVQPMPACLSLPVHTPVLSCPVLSCPVLVFHCGIISLRHPCRFESLQRCLSGLPGSSPPSLALS
jgi:hypothetical protein